MSTPLRWIFQIGRYFTLADHTLLFVHSPRIRPEQIRIHYLFRLLFDTDTKLDTYAQNCAMYN